MARVNERVPGAMAAILGLPISDVTEICARSAAATGQVVEIANDNEPMQVVVSGQAEAVRQAVAAATDAGARKVVALEVGAPFHCSLMAEIEEEFAAALEDVVFKDPDIEMISSVTADRVSTADEAKEVLRRQLTARVRWTGTVNRMASAGVGWFIEVGPGKVLDGLCRRIIPGIQTYTTNDTRQRAQTLAALSYAE